MTSATQLVVIYATNSRTLRRKIIPDSDAQLAFHQPGPGESRLVMPLSQTYDDVACRAAIANATGVAPPSGRCSIVDAAGVVIGVCNADPELDTHPAGQLVAHATAGSGDRRENGVFKRAYAIIDRATNRVTSIAYLPLDNLTAPSGSFLITAENRKVGEFVAESAIPPLS